MRVVRKTARNGCVGEVGRIGGEDNLSRAKTIRLGVWGRSVSAATEAYPRILEVAYFTGSRSRITRWRSDSKHGSCSFYASAFPGSVLRCGTFGTSITRDSRLADRTRSCSSFSSAASSARLHSIRSAACLAKTSNIRKSRSDGVCCSRQCVEIIPTICPVRE